MQWKKQSSCIVLKVFDDPQYECEYELSHIYRHTSLPHTGRACCYRNSAVSLGTYPLAVCGQ